MRSLFGTRADTHSLTLTYVSVKRIVVEDRPIDRQGGVKIADRELCEGLLAENCVIKRGRGLEMEKESENKKLRKRFREEGREERGEDSVLSCLR